MNINSRENRTRPRIAILVCVAMLAFLYIAATGILIAHGPPQPSTKAETSILINNA